jgi:carbonic anhydrase/acetyltransferase-like protein (isoleucine patch superfamily)
MNYDLLERRVRALGSDHYIAPNAVLIGDVTLHAGVTVWFGAVLRGDNTAIVIGEESNIQDGCILHTDPGFELRVGQRVTVGHGAILHSCDIGDNSLIGIHATILTGAVVGRDCIVGANSLVTEGARIPDGYLAFGSPARPQRMLTDAEREMIRHSAGDYYERGKRYTTLLQPVTASAVPNERESRSS